MRAIETILLSFGVLIFSTSAVAAEGGIVIRAGELKEQPFVDAATIERVAANQAVSIVRRQGGWVQVESNGKTGWVRMLNLRLATIAAAAAPGASAGGDGNANRASRLRTGSSGKTVTTGVKGLGEENLRNATVDTAQLAILATLAVDAEVAKANALASGLKESSVEYLKNGSRN